MRYLFIATALFVVGCQQNSNSTTAEADTAPASGSTVSTKSELKARAFKIAQAIAADMKLDVVEACVANESLMDISEDKPAPKNSFNVAFGEADSCDPHYSLDIFFDDSENFLMARLNDF